MLEFLRGDSFRRIVAAVVAVALPIVNKLTGLELDDAQLVAIIAAIGVYIAQSGLHAAARTKAEVAAGAHVDAATIIANGNLIASKLAQSVADSKPTPPDVRPPL